MSHGQFTTDNTATPTSLLVNGGALSAQEGSASLTAADKWTYSFYAAGALSALVGQVWAAVEHVPFPETVPIWLRWAIVTPAVAVVEIGGVAMAARADLRRRQGEGAIGYRVLSAAVAAFAVAFNWFGHGAGSWLAFWFAGFSALAYVVWLLHSGDRRRDALRGRDKLAKIAPVYGFWQWISEPRLTARARSLAVEYDLGVHESLRMAREHRRESQRNAALVEHIRERIAARYKDKNRAQIATTTADLDRLAEHARNNFPYAAWGLDIASDLGPHAADSDQARELTRLITAGNRPTSIEAVPSVEEFTFNDEVDELDLLDGPGTLPAIEAGRVNGHIPAGVQETLNRAGAGPLMTQEDLAGLGGRHDDLEPVSAPPALVPTMTAGAIRNDGPVAPAQRTVPGERLGAGERTAAAVALRLATPTTGTPAKSESLRRRVFTWLDANVPQGDARDNATLNALLVEQFAAEGSAKDTVRRAVWEWRREVESGKRVQRPGRALRSVPASAVDGEAQ